jgi:hypothetical protein
MMTKAKLALAALALLQIVPAADAASRKHHEARAYSAYAYAPGAYGSSAYGSSTYGSNAYGSSGYAPWGEFKPSDYYYAQEAFGWNAGLYPFNFAPDGRRVPLRSGGLCWTPTAANPVWAPCS